MPTNHRARLAHIRRFDQLVAYLRDELDWPLGPHDFEDLTFDYTPGELGIDAKNEAKIEYIKRLRPLTTGQPWGIFFVKFEPKQLPVVALRRILGRVTLKTRASASFSERQAWDVDDLLFVSNYGDDEQRNITFAHFSRPQHSRDLPTLKVLGWDNRDTPLHLDAVARELTENLAWPEEDDDLDSWRERWRSAFGLQHGEVIKTSKQLSERLAEVARAIRDRTLVALDIETESGPLTNLLKAFQTTLVHDLDEAKFADMYAQTITYGLLSARITDPAGPTVDDLATHMQTNPFLRELMEAFLSVGGRGGAVSPNIDFDELGVSEVVELLDQANMEAVVRDFGDRNPREDPVIHFYEHFLAAYDKTEKVRRGVFYTPRPVVSYIVRSVDGLLRSEFDLADGLADTTTWGELSKRHDGPEVPEAVSPEQAFVQILDPATGTGTFLVEVIDLISNTMAAKWRSQGHGEQAIRALWNEYVPKHLLPRLHGYELLMAPYAIAHLKIGLKLYETGYSFGGDERARVYLTNALEPPREDEQFTLDFLPALAHEAAAVNEIKRRQRFTVVIGNPPYLGEAGRGGDWIAALMRGRDKQSDRKTLSYFEVDGRPLNERTAKWLNDLYVRFTRLSQWLLERTGCGVHGYITNHGYLDNPTFRGMRWALLATFDQLSLLDLHGNLKKKEVMPDGRRDENVFDIEPGVAIGLFVKALSSHTRQIPRARVRHADCWGLRTAKYDWLLTGNMSTSGEIDIEPRPPFHLFRKVRSRAEYERFWRIKDVMPVNGVGMTTARDHVVIDFDRTPLLERVRRFRDSTDSDEELCRQLAIPLKKGWSVPNARESIGAEGDLAEHIKPVLYRPFDQRVIFYHDSLVWRTVKKIMPHMFSGGNQALCVGRAGQVTGSSVWDVSFSSTSPSDFNMFRRGGHCLFPLYLYPGVGEADRSLFNRWAKGKDGRTPNLDTGFVDQIAAAIGLQFVGDGSGDLWRTFGPEDICAWIYAVFHSPRYRERYEAHLKLDFPRVPPCSSVGLFRSLAKAGHELLAYHMLESLRLAHPITTYTGPRHLEVGRVGWSDDTVWLDAVKTIAREGHRATVPGTAGFQGVPEEVWDFHVGGYQVCHKWLKDRKGRRLSDEDVAHYQKIVVALNETIRIMAEIDEVVEVHGGWPDAFHTALEPVEERPPASG